MSYRRLPSSRSFVAGLLVLGSILTGCCVAATGAQAGTSTKAPPAGYLVHRVVSDDFNRTVRSGWGSAPVGGPYRGYGQAGQAMTARGNAYFAGVPAGRSRVQQSSVVAADVLVTTTVNLSRIPRRGSWNAYVGLDLRVQSDGRAYSASVRVQSGGRARLLIDRRPSHGRSTQLTSRHLSKLRAGTTYVLQAAVVGGRIWARAYRSTGRSGSWVTAYDSSRAAIRSAGRTGIVLTTVGRHTSSSARFGSLNVYSPARSVATPAPPTSTRSTPGSSHAGQVIARAGSAALGTTSYPVPAGALIVSTAGSDTSGNGSAAAPFASVTRALRNATPGSTIVLRGGVYHESIYVRAGLQVGIQAYPGETVWFDGSVAVTGWTRSGNDWAHSGWNAQFDHSASFSKGSNAGGFVNSAYPMAAWPDQVFVDGEQLQQVAANPSAGEFAVDYAGKRLIVGSDPSGHAVRASDLSQSFVVAGRATLRGFGIRRFATSLPQMGTLFIGGSGGSVVQNVVVDNSAGQGISTASPNDVIDHVTMSANGMSGMSAAYSNGLVVENSLITGNNTQHFNAAPSAGGLKVGRLDGVTIRDNLVQNNLNIDGLWTDENVTHFAITGNVVRGNGTTTYGIVTELSDTGIVANNTISGSKYGYTAFDSGNIAVFNNDVTDNAVWDIGLTQDNRWQPGKGTAGSRVQPSSANPWLVQNIVVANNNFGRVNGMFQFYVLDKQTNRSANSMNLQVVGNQFAARSNSARPWAIGWGMGDNRTVHTYATSGAFNSGEQKNWVNVTAADNGTGCASASAVASSARPLPGDVAAAIGQSRGARHVGTF